MGGIVHTMLPAAEMWYIMTIPYLKNCINSLKKETIMHIFKGHSLSSNFTVASGQTARSGAILLLTVILSAALLAACGGGSGGDGGGGGRADTDGDGIADAADNCPAVSKCGSK